MAVKLKSTMNMMSHAGRDHASGDQIIVPKVVTRSRKMWLRIPMAQIPHSAMNEGASHFRHFATTLVSPARITVQIGRQSNECVMLRCQVSISNSLCEKRSRRTSLSGKTAPSIKDQVMRRRLLSDRGENRSRPPNTALLISAPAMPCVMVSTVSSSSPLLDHHQELGCLWHDTADPLGVHTMTLEAFPRRFLMFRSERDQKAAGRLRVKEQRAIFLGHVRGEADASP